MLTIKNTYTRQDSDVWFAVVVRILADTLSDGQVSAIYKDGKLIYRSAEVR